MHLGVDTYESVRIDRDVLGNEETPMPNQPRTRTVTRLSLVLEHIVETYPSAPPFAAARKIITTTGETVEELPPSQPSIRSARPANVVQFPVVRRVAGAGK